MKYNKFYFLCIVLTSQLFSCSTMKLARQYADWYIVSEIDDAFDLSDAQEDWVDKSVDQHLLWFDKTLLNELLAYMDDVHKKTSSALTEKEIDEIFKGYVDLRILLMNRLAPDSARLFLSLSEKQVKHFQNYLEEQNEEQVERLKLSDADFKEEIWDDRLDNLEEWFGDLSDTQKERIKKLWPISKEAYEFWLSYRRETHKTLINLAKTKPNQTETTFKKWGKSPELMVTKDFATKRLKMRNDARTVIKKVYGQMNPEQIVFFRKKLKKMRDDLAQIND